VALHARMRDNNVIRIAAVLSGLVVVPAFYIGVARELRATD
jgi:hypothetical protein